MSYYLYIYIISICVSFFGGWLVWKQTKNTSGFFFLMFIFFLSTWFGLYLIFFSGVFTEEYLLYISRLTFASGIISVYSLLYFIIYFGRTDKKIFTGAIIYTLILFFSITYLYFFTDKIIYSLEYSQSEGVYREVNGSLFWLHILGHLSFLLLFCYFSYKTIQSQDNLNRIRLKNILVSSFLLLFSLIILQLILPYFGVWILEKEIIFIFAAFVISVPIIIRRYYFSHFGYGLGKIFVHVVSLVLSFLLIEAVKYFFLQFDAGYLGHWRGSYGGDIFDTFSIIICYAFISSGLRKIFLGDKNIRLLTFEIQKIKKSISRVADISELNTVLKDAMYNIYKSRDAYIEIYLEGQQNLLFSEVQHFFEENKEEPVFINDIVFIESHKQYFGGKNISRKIPKNIFLIFPLYSIGGIYIGNFLVGTKRFGDFYTLFEIDTLKEFSFFLEIHLKYLRTYGSLQDLSMNLDKKVDEKTMEYNNLLNRQKEFISLISHEIKSPISSAIFQSDSMMDDLDTKNISPEVLREDLGILNSQLVRTGGLISKLFSVQYYDNHNVSLFLESIEFGKFLEYEIGLFSHMYEDIRFISYIDMKIGFIQIDKIQFQQVINNLLDNAVKFIQKDNPIISIKARKVTQGIEISIEDNGVGIEGIELETIFDKYTTGSNKNIGLGMGLYLCKKIISMHNGTIEASISEQYAGACFTIFLPIS